LLSDPESDAGIMLSLLLRAFCLFPRVVIAACLQPWRQPAPRLMPSECRAALMLLELLLSEGPLSPALAASPLHGDARRRAGGDCEPGHDRHGSQAARANGDPVRRRAAYAQGWFGGLALRAPAGGISSTIHSRM
jgi:hypothetical protein